MEGEYELVCNLSTGAIPMTLTWISRSRCFVSPNNSKTVRARAIITMAD